MRGSETVTEEEKKATKPPGLCVVQKAWWCGARSLNPVLYVCVLLFLFCISHLKKKKKKPFKIPSFTVSMKILNKIWETRVQMVCKEQCPQNQQTQVWRSQGVNNEKGMKSTVFLLCLQL